MKIGGRKIERKLKVSDFVEKEGAKLKLKINKEMLEMIIRDMMKSHMKCGVIAIVDGVNYSTLKKLLKTSELPFIEEISKG